MSEAFEPVTNERLASSEMRLNRMAIRRGWAIDPNKKARLVERACEIAENAKDARAAVNAIRSVVEMEEQNMKIDKESASVEAERSVSAVEKTTKETTYRIEFDKDG